jgi:hypothetical protein
MARGRGGLGLLRHGVGAALCEGLAETSARWKGCVGKGHLLAVPRTPGTYRYARVVSISATGQQSSPPRRPYEKVYNSALLHAERGPSKHAVLHAGTHACTLPRIDRNIKRVYTQPLWPEQGRRRHSDALPSPLDAPAAAPSPAPRPRNGGPCAAVRREHAGRAGVRDDHARRAPGTFR